MAVLKIIEEKAAETYSDGDQIESEILEYVRNNPSDDYSNVLAQDQRWPVFYHLTDMRENILNWYDFTPGCDVLEIGAGMGALTGLLCRKASTVTSVELTLPRAKVIQERCRQHNNLKIIVGNFNRMEFPQQYDYITLIGVLEYAPGFTESGDLSDFLRKIHGLLKPGGKLLIAIENRFGLKYWCGAQEDHTGVPYFGINGYDEKSFVRTYSRSELMELLSANGLEYARYYYPLPDYKLPQILFSDAYLPKQQMKGKVLCYYTGHPVLLTDEAKALNNVIQNDAFPFMANSFFVEACDKPLASDQPIFATFTSERVPEEQIVTKIYDDDRVSKCPATPKAVLHLQEIYDNQKAFNSPSLLPYALEDGNLVMPFVHDRTLEEILIDAVRRTDREAVKYWIKKFSDEVLSSSEYEIVNEEPILKTGFLEMNFQNCFVHGDQLSFFDQEWTEQNVRAAFILYRAIRTFYWEHAEAEDFIPKSELFSTYCRGLDPTDAEQQEIEFTKKILRQKGNPLYMLFAFNGEIRKDVLKNVRAVDRRLEEQNTEISRQSAEISRQSAEISRQSDELNATRQSLLEKERTIEAIESTLSWRITRPVSNLKNAACSWMDNYSFTRKAHKALFVLRRRGAKELVESYKRYRGRRNAYEDAARFFGESPENTASSNNKDGYLPFDAEYQNNIDFSGQTTDVKMLAFYLPQFHAIPENDAWWGKGFTEWDNVRSGESRFLGHYQPRVPHSDIGYYSLDGIETLRRQAELAKQHGIYGFCFYYYWFSGKRLLEKPVDMLLQHKEIDLPFCLCWANENWTRAWDGQNKNVLIQQDYTERDDEVFMLDLKKYIDDPRYIRIHGKPLIVVYNPGQIPSCRKSFAKWREAARAAGIGEILIWTCQTANNTAEKLKIEDSIDAEVEFPPHNMWMAAIAVRDLDLGGRSANIYNYQRLVSYIEGKLKQEENPRVPVHHSVMLAWDNAARRKDNWFTLYAFSLHSFYRWILAISVRARKDFDEEERFVFVNAWNEWGEGTYLEPDEKYGYAYINTASKALFGLPFRNDLKILSPSSPSVEREQFEKSTDVASPRIAVQAHIFYVDTLDEIIRKLNLIPFPFDCYISTDTAEKKKQIEERTRQSSKARHTEVGVFPNRGRDVAPFLMQMAPVMDRYDYVCHIHSKKTKTNEHGNEWRNYNFQHLFGSEEYLKRVFWLFETDERMGIVMPETYPVLELQAEWGGNKEGVEALLTRVGCGQPLPADPVFPVGNMFWARTKAVRKIFDAGLTQEDFPKEAGQVNATIAHQIERSWVYVARAAGYGYCKTFNNFGGDAALSDRKRLGIFMHYDVTQKISDEDIKTVQYFSKLFTKLVFVTNSSLSDEQLDLIRPFVGDVYVHENVGLDFGGWRHCLLSMGEEEVSGYDELILLNNSCLKPVFDMQEVFSAMESKALDFWGITVFPYSPDGSYIHKDCIPEHIQSYFMVFNRPVLQSPVFWSFWKNMREYTDFIDVVGNCESQLTRILADAGFSYEPYIRETYYLSRFLNNYAIPYEKPTSLLLLKDPFVKKKCFQYMSNEEECKLYWLLKAFKSGKQTECGTHQDECCTDWRVLPNDDERRNGSA